MTEQITFTLAGHTRTAEVPDGTAQTIVAAFVDAYAYQQTLQNDAGDTVANPETPQDFTARKIREYIQEIVGGYVKKLARAQADAAADQQLQGLLGNVTVVPRAE
jgi:hypothetical protein